MKVYYLPLFFIVICNMAISAYSQNTSSDEGYLTNWFDRVSKTQSEQPHWITPMFTTTPRLEEEFRYDIGSENTSKGQLTNYGVSKGLELIPSEHTEVIIGLPPYISHDYAKAIDGFGDVSFLLKYRILAANEESGNYIVTAFLGMTIPTGEYKNGSSDAVITPTLAFGKGWGNFNFQSTVGVGIPTGSYDALGTPVPWNTAFQYRILKKIWPEIEVNATFFPNGDHSGNQQVFLSPGLVVGRLHLYKRLGLTIGGGIQIAATHFHTYDQNRVLSIRFPF
ncbi:MAG TPA: transporter [Terriglobales bacterium]|nr:transporter [Terriglobales bacterium]